jgi:glutamyl-tRNA reductase
MAFLSVGVDHEHVPLDVLERATIPEESWGKLLRSLLANANIDEAVVLSTCLRTEVYASIDRFHGAVEEITATLADATGLDLDELTDRLTIHFDRGVVGHLFRVAAGLSSAVPGEHEVLGQIRRALERADEEHAVGPELAELFRRALSAGRRVRHETAIARGTTSFAAATVDLALTALGDDLNDATAVVVGAGQLATGVVRSLMQKAPTTSVTIVNRTIARADELAAAFDPSRVSTAPLSDLGDVVATARLVVTAVEVPHALITTEMVATRVSPLLVIDLGMPRVASSEISQLATIDRRDISDLRDVVQRALDDRRDAVNEAVAVVEEEVERFHEDRRSRGAAAIVGELRDRLEALRVQELERRRADLASLTDEQRELVESLTRSVVAKIAHTPTVSLKEAAGTDRGQRLTEATRTLFGL